MNRNNVGYEFSNDMHGERYGFVPFSETAIARVGEIVPPRTWMGRRQFRNGTGGCEDVLAFGFLNSHTSPHIEAQLPQLDPEPFEQFFLHEIARVDRGDPEFELDDGELHKLRCLAWLARELEAPVAYWDHEGWEGLQREYAFGFDVVGEKAMEFFNEMEIQPRSYPRERPRSAVTACLWHVGARSENCDEAAYPGEIRAFHSLG